MRLVGKLQKVFNLAMNYHDGQKRKYTKEPYFFHLYNVGETVWNNTCGNVLLTAVAFCHDILEDTHMTEDMLRLKLRMIGFNVHDVEYITAGVISLTDLYTKEKFPGFNRKERKEKEAKRLWVIKPDYQTVKYADLLDNTSSIVSHDPDFSKIYMREKFDLLRGMNAGDVDLFAECMGVVQTYFTLEYQAQAAGILKAE